MAPLAPRDLFQTAVLSQIPSSLENKDKFKQQQRQGQRTMKKVNANKKAKTNVTILIITVGLLAFNSRPL